MENEKIAKKICQLVLDEIPVQIVKVLNVKDAEIARLDQYIEELIDKNDSLSSQVAKYRKILEFISNHCTKDYTREIERPEFNAMMESLYSQAKQALEDTPKEEK